MINKAHKLGCFLLALALLAPPVYAQDNQSAPIRTESGIAYEKPFHEGEPEEKDDISMPESHTSDRIADLDAAVEVWARNLGIEVDQDKVRETEAKALDSSPREVLLTRIDGDGEIDESFFDELPRDDTGRQIVRLENAALHWDPAKREGIVRPLSEEGAEGEKFFNIERRFRHSVTCASDYTGFVFSESGCEAGDTRDNVNRFVAQRKDLIGSSLHMKSRRYGAVYDWFGNDAKQVTETVPEEKPAYTANPKEMMMREMFQHESWIKAELAKTKGLLAEEDMAVEMGGQKIDARIGQLSQVIERVRAAASENPAAAEFIRSAEQFLQSDLEALIESYLQSRSENIEILHARKAELEKALMLVPGIQQEIEATDRPEELRPGIEKFVTWIQEAVRTLKIEKKDDESGSTLFELLDELIELGRGLAVEASHAREKAQQNELIQRADVLHRMIDEGLRLQKEYDAYRQEFADDEKSLPEFEPAIAAVLELQTTAKELRGAQDVNDFDRLRQLLSSSRLANLESSENDFVRIAERFREDLKAAAEARRLSAQEREERELADAREQERNKEEISAEISGIAQSLPRHIDAIEKIESTVQGFKNDIDGRMEMSEAFGADWTRRAGLWRSDALSLGRDLAALKEGFNEMSERASAVLNLSVEELTDVRQFIQERGAVLKPVYISTKNQYRDLTEGYRGLMAAEPRPVIEPKPVPQSRIVVESSKTEEDYSAVIAGEDMQVRIDDALNTETQVIEKEELVSSDPAVEEIVLSESQELQGYIMNDAVLPQKQTETKTEKPADNVPVSAEKAEKYYQKLLMEEESLIKLELNVEDLKLDLKNLYKQTDLLEIRLAPELKLSRKELAARRAEMPELFKDLRKRDDLNESIHAIITYRRDLLSEKDRFEQLKQALDGQIYQAISLDLEQRKAAQSEIYSRLDSSGSGAGGATPSVTTV